MDNWQEDTNAWEDESDAAWEAEEVLRWYVLKNCSCKQFIDAHQHQF